MKLYIVEAKKHLHHEAGRALLQWVLRENGLQDALILVGEKGKPYIEGAEFYFNISHSGNYVVLVTGASEVGVDIQEKKAVKAEALSKRFFSEEEHRMITSVENKIELFCKLWTRKEAYGKWRGSGLTEEILKSNMLEVHEDVFFVEYTEMPDYQICICSGKEEEIEEVISVSEGL